MIVRQISIAFQKALCVGTLIKMLAFLLDNGHDHIYMSNFKISFTTSIKFQILKTRSAYKNQT